MFRLTQDLKIKIGSVLNCNMLDAARNLCCTPADSPCLASCSKEGFRVPKTMVGLCWSISSRYVSKLNMTVRPRQIATIWSLFLELQLIFISIRKHGHVEWQNKTTKNASAFLLTSIPSLWWWQVVRHALKPKRAKVCNTGAETNFRESSYEALS